MRDQSNFLVGLTFLLAMVGLAVLLFLFGELESVFVRTYPLTIRTDNAAGLRAGSPIVLNGVRVGSVTSIAFQRDPDRPQMPVEVLARIEAEVRIPAEAEFRIEQALIGGGSTLALYGAEGDRLLPTDGGARLEGRYRSAVEQVTDAVDERLQPMLQTLAGIEQFTSTYTEVGEELAELLRLQDPQSGEVANLRTAIGTLNELLNQTSSAVSAADTWLSDETLKGTTTRTLEEAGQFFEQATSTASQVAEVADQLREQTETLLRQIEPVAEQLAATLTETQAMVRLGTQGSGTVGQLLNNPDLYNSLVDASVRLERTLVQLQLLLEKAKAEGVPVNF